MTLIQEIDYTLFLIVNKGLSHPVLDYFFLFITNATVIVSLFALFMVLYLIRHRCKRNVVIQVVLGALLLGVTDFTTHRGLKPLFNRKRPCNPSYFNEHYEHSHLPDANFLTKRKGSKSLPSTHAVSIAAQATYWALLFPIGTPVAVVIAILIGGSRIYVGVHYPMDVLLGFIVGIFWGVLFWFLAKKLKALPNHGE